MSREFNFDGLVGPTHNYAGLSRGNFASVQHQGLSSNPRAAARQGLAKMARLRALGVGQAVLPPHPRPDVSALRRCGFAGSDEAVVRAARQEAPELLCAVSSASAMWTANAATVAPSQDTCDGRVHFVAANLVHLFHRSLEAETTTRVLQSLFSDARHFVVHPALPAHARFGDEGAANHTRLFSSIGAAQVFCWGRDAEALRAPRKQPARQTLEASQAVARALGLRPGLAILAQQEPAGIDGGAFHSDVLMVGNGSFLMLHEAALCDAEVLLSELSAKLGPEFKTVIAREAELPIADAVQAYPFNSQLVTLPDATMLIVAPEESRNNERARRFLERVCAESNPVCAVEYLDVRQSMSNGGGPACLRLRVPLESRERAAVAANVILDDQLERELGAWIDRHYRDRLGFDDLGDPALLRDGHTALDELTQLLGLGPVYEFQRG